MNRWLIQENGLAKLRVTSTAEVKREYANKIFSHMNLEVMVEEFETDAKTLPNINRGEDFELSFNTRKEAFMRQVTAAMVRQEKKIRRPGRLHKKLREESTRRLRRSTRHQCYGSKGFVRRYGSAGSVAQEDF